MIRPSHMDDSNNSCLATTIIAILLAVCFPLGIIAIFVYSAWDNTSETTQHTIAEWIQMIILGFALISYPILAFISLFAPIYKPHEIAIFWIITIAELIFLIHKCYKKHKNKNKHLNND
jgi:Na+-driven multidrug efflux pump